VKTFRFPAFAGCLIAVSLGLVHAPIPAADDLSPPAKAEEPKGIQSATQGAAYKVEGQCVDHADNSPVAGVRVLLFEARGRAFPILQIGESTTDAKGGFAFLNLAPPRETDGLDRLEYKVLVVDPNWAIGMGFFGFPPGPVMQVRLSREQGALTGKVVNARGQPVAAAIVANFSLDGREIPGILSATTGADGRFTIDKLPVIRIRDGSQLATGIQVLHRDYPAAQGRADELPADVTVTLPDGCVVTGHVADAVTGKPAANALVWSQRLQRHVWQETFTSTDSAGHFRMVLPEGRYHFLAEGPDRISVALTDRECVSGQPLELPPIQLIEGGLISGQVINTSTHQPVASSRGNPIILGLYGPSHPPTPGMTSPARVTSVDAAGRFNLRAAPGDNFPYLVNQQGDRMAWDTQQQPPVVVKEGQTTAYNMLITPQIPPRDKLKAARALVASLPKVPAERTARILAEFDRLKGGMSENLELFCSLMRELVTIGPPAVPQICEELDRTNQGQVLRRLAFALRAIGDPRAVPSLIRAIPKTLLPPSSDFGLIVPDPELAAFMHKHDLDHSKGLHFGYGRPVREVFGALQQLTGQDFDDSEVYRIHRCQDPRRRVLQLRLYLRQARKWQTWWEANWTKFTRDPAYEKVHLSSSDETVPPPKPLSHSSYLGDGLRGEVLSPPEEQGKHVTHFYDLDTGCEPKWPAGIPRDESRLDQKQLAQWALDNGVDLMCVTHRAADGTETYVLKTFGLEVHELTERELRNTDRTVIGGNLPTGRAIPPGDLLMHHDLPTGQPNSGAGAAFLYTTREGNQGLIEITDHITRTENLTGFTGNEPKGVGFHRGVKFDLKSIIP
jgi:5-hydroxyisourate hydrolase-like protein (transthyretin family)